MRDCGIYFQDEIKEVLKFWLTLAKKNLEMKFFLIVNLILQFELIERYFLDLCLYTHIHLKLIINASLNVFLINLYLEFFFAQNNTSNVAVNLRSL